MLQHEIPPLLCVVLSKRDNIVSPLMVTYKTAAAIVLLVFLTALRVCGDTVQSESDIVAEFLLAAGFMHPVNASTLCSDWTTMITCIDGSVTTIDFTAQSLSGTLPESLANLSRLTSFTVALNSLRGTLSSQWSRWGSSIAVC
jgi:hypothetical protein